MHNAGVSQHLLLIYECNIHLFLNFWKCEFQDGLSRFFYKPMKNVYLLSTIMIFNDLAKIIA